MHLVIKESLKLGRKKKIYSRRSSSYLVPTLVILCVSVAVAWGGAVYWSDLQEKKTANNQQKYENVMKIHERQEE